MTILEFIKDKNIDGNVYLLSKLELKQKTKSEILDITHKTLTKREDYIKSKKIESIEGVEEIPSFIYENLNVEYLFKVWLLYSNKIKTDREILKYLDLSRNDFNLRLVNKALEVVRENLNEHVEELTSAKYTKEELSKRIVEQWKNSKKVVN